MLDVVQKNAIDFVISLSPTIVNLTRTEYQEDEGARKAVTSTIAAQTWLVYPHSVARKKKYSGNEAELEHVTEWLALAPSDADVKWGANVLDTFVLSGRGAFQVSGGRVISIGDTITGYHVELRVVT